MRLSTVFYKNNSLANTSVHWTATALKHVCDRTSSEGLSDSRVRAVWCLYELFCRWFFLPLSIMFLIFTDTETCCYRSIILTAIYWYTTVHPFRYLSRFPFPTMAAVNISARALLSQVIFLKRTSRSLGRTVWAPPTLPQVTKPLSNFILCSLVPSSG